MMKMFYIILILKFSFFRSSTLAYKLTSRVSNVNFSSLCILDNAPESDCWVKVNGGSKKYQSRVTTQK